MMKKLILILCILLGLNVSGQQNPFCGSEGLLKELLQNNPEYQDTLLKLIPLVENFKTSNAEGNDFTIYIPVIFHIVSDDPQSSVNISDQQITSQLLALNSAFSNFSNNSLSVDTKITFCFARQDPAGNNLTTPGISRTYVGQNSYYIADNYVSSDELALRGTDYWPANHYLNIWVANLKKSTNHSENFIAKSHFPFVNNGAPDGIIINSNYCGNNIGTATIPNYSDGTILAHEAGHWLGLFHIFENSDPSQNGNCDNCTGTNLNGDQVPDTQPCRGPAWYDPYWQSSGSNKALRNTCDNNCTSVTPLISAENYMDYNFTQYLNFFSADQSSRMRSMCKSYRWYFYETSMKNPGAFPIECTANDLADNINLTEYGCPKCTTKVYPDVWLRMNGDESQFIELCCGINPVFNFIHPSNGKCSLFPAFKHNIECTDESNFYGNCHNSSKCTWSCEQVGACSCWEYLQRVRVSFSYGCDDNYNCAFEKAMWFFYEPNHIPCNFDALSELGLHGFQNTPGKFKLSIGTIDGNGNSHFGTKYLTYISNDITFPYNNYGSYSIPTNQKAINNIVFTGNSLIPSNSTYAAGNEIYLKDETKTNGFIESDFKIYPIICSNALQREIGDMENLTSSISPTNTVKPSRKRNASQDEINDTYNYYSPKKVENNPNSNNTDLISVNPNPSENGIFYFENKSESAQNIDIRVYNSSMQFLNVDCQQNRINLVNFPKGIYFIEFKINNKSEFKKVIRN